LALAGGSGDAAQAKPETRCALPLSILTKYYEAPTELLVVPAEVQPWTAAGSSSDATGAGPSPLEGAEAVIHVVNASATTAARVVAEVAGLAAALDDAGAEAELRILLLSHADAVGGPEWGGQGDGCGAAAAASASSSGRPLDALLSALTDVTLDHGFEVVPANALAPGLGSEGRDKRGLGRVLEALQTVMWSTMDMSKGVGAGGAGSRAAGPLAAAGAGESAGLGPLDDADGAVAGASGEGEAGAAVGGEDAAAGAEAGSSEAGISGEGPFPGAEFVPGASLLPLGEDGLPMDPEGEGEGEGEGGGGGGGGDGGFDFDGLSDMIRQANDLKTSGAALGRKERQDRAAEVALRMAVLMGIDADDATAMLAEMAGTPSKP